MRPLQLNRDSEAKRVDQIKEGHVLARDVRGADGKVALAKGRMLSPADISALHELPWSELHLLEMEAGELHEEPAGKRIARALVGAGDQAQGVIAKDPDAGSSPMMAKHRGILEVDSARLARINALDDLAVASMPTLQIVIENELVARAKVLPFITREEIVNTVESIGNESGPIVRVRPFVHHRVAAFVFEDKTPLDPFRRTLETKLGFFGSTLISLVHALDSNALGSALGEARAAGAELFLIAGGHPMDPIDPAPAALESAGGRIEKRGLPAYPGALIWLGYLGDAPAIGIPSCGVASRATSLDLLLPILLTGQRPDRIALATLGDGGMLVREGAHRLAPYASGRARGELVRT